MFLFKQSLCRFEEVTLDERELMIEDETHVEVGCFARVIAYQIEVWYGRYRSESPMTEVKT